MGSASESERATETTEHAEEGRHRAATLLFAAVALLAALDLARAVWGAGLRPWQWAAGLLTLVLLDAWLRTRRARFVDRLPELALAALLLPVYVEHTRMLQSDGIHYYTYLRSLLFDADLDLANDFVLLGSDYRSPNVLPVGAAVLWSPLVLVVHLLAQAARLFGAPAPDGTEPAYQAAACLATFFYGGAGLFLLLGRLRGFAGAAAAFWAVLACWLGTPLRFYLSVLPSLAHGGEFFGAVLSLAAYLAFRRGPSPRRAAALGAAIGVAVLARSQTAVFLLLPAIELVLLLWRGPDRRRPFALGGVLAAAFLGVASIQMAVWLVMFGTPILVPHKVLHGEGFMRLAEPQLAGTLIGAEGGLFASYPLTLVAVLGTVGLAFGLRPRGRAPTKLDARYALSVVPILLATWYVNSTVFDWYQVRRFTGVVPLLAPGLALALGPLARAGLVWPALLVFAAWRYDLAVDTLRPQPGRPVPVQAALVETGDGLARDGYALLEPRAPRLAVRLLAAYTGERLLHEPVSVIDLSGRPSVLRLPEPARHLSEPEAEDGALGRWVEDQDTRFFLPLAWEGGVAITLRARALETLRPQAIEAAWNGRELDRQGMVAAWSDYRFRVPAEAVRPGTNVLEFRFERRPIYHQTRGSGPRKVRPAALASITLHRTD